MINHYKILGVSEYSSKSDIKKAYRKLSKIYHPDRGVNNSEKFIQINNSYQILINDYKRAEFDNLLKSYRFKNQNTNYNKENIPPKYTYDRNSILFP